jgi:hypothetical protein
MVRAYPEGGLVVVGVQQDPGKGGGFGVRFWLSLTRVTVEVAFGVPPEIFNCAEQPVGKLP